MDKSIFSFTIRLFVVIGFAFSIHLFVLHTKGLPLWENLIIPSYLYNTITSFVSFLILIKLKPKWISNMGFIFMAGSFLKFLIFFLAFYPSYQADDEVTSLEFFAFFIPYGMGLIVEIASLVQRLNKD